MLEVAPGWHISTNRGPDWLFVKLHGPSQAQGDVGQLADSIWSLLDQHLTKRLVLELDEAGPMRTCLINELVKLHRRVTEADGLMRLSGLSDLNYQVLRTSRLETHFPRYENVLQAVMGWQPNKPR